MGIIRALAVKFYRKDINRFIKILSECSEEKLASILIYSVWLRAILQLEGHLNPYKGLIEKFPDQEIPDLYLEPELTAYPLMLQELEKIISFFDKTQPAKSTVLKIWVHTLRAIVRPELTNEAKNLWNLLLTSEKYWDIKTNDFFNEDIGYGFDRKFVEATRELSIKILRCIPPKEIYNSTGA